MKNIIPCKVEENFHTKRLTEKFLVTMTTNIARKEHMEKHKENYERVDKS